MFDQVQDDVKPKIEPAVSAFLDQLQEPFSAGNIADSKAEAGFNKSNNKGSLNDLLFDPAPLDKALNNAFKPGPLNFDGNHSKVLDNIPRLDTAPRLDTVPIPKPRPADLGTKRTEEQKPAPLSRDQKTALKELTAFKFGPITSTAMAEAKVITEQLIKEPNKATALPKYKGRFEDAIAAADKNYFDTEKRQTPIIVAAELKYGMAVTRLTDSIGTFEKEIEKLPPAVQKKVEQLKADFGDPAQTEKAQKRFANDFKDYPDFVATTEKLLSDFKAEEKTESDLNTARKPLVDAAREEAVTRYVYKRAADLAGNTALSKSIGEEALLMAQRAIEIEQKEKPKAGRLISI